MSLDSLEAAFAAPPQPRRQCKVCDIVNRLEGRAQELVTAALADREQWSNMAIATRLTGQGIPVGTEAIRRHRSVCE